MKFLLYFSIFFIFLVAGCVAKKPCANNQDTEYIKEPLTLTLELEKIIYSSTDSIMAKIVLANQGNTSLIVNSRMALNFSSALTLDRDLELIILEQSGAAVPFIVKLRVSPLVDDDFVVLESGDLVQSSYNLGEFYQIDDAGDYSAFAIYENRSDPTNGLCSWKGKLISNKIFFTLKP